MPPSDLVVVGAGCAGLSLAAHLVERGALRGRRLVLLDARARYSHDRTFCFWSFGGGLFDGSVAARWPRWTVRAEGRAVTRAAPGLSYACIPGDAFYAAAQARLAAAGASVELRLGVAVHDLHDAGDRVCLITSEGPREASLVFDSRPVPAPSLRHVTLLQHFRGHVVETDADVFDPQAATLMDFVGPQERGVHFVYVLPFTPRRALVESTFFSHEPAAPTVYDGIIDDYLRTKVGARAWAVRHTEAGVIPMTTAPFALHPSPRVVRVGLAGGFARPSTGYAFAATQRWARAAAEVLAEDRPFRAPPLRAPRYAALDATLLSLLDRDPAKGAGLFLRLFERVEPARLARFLSDESSMHDDLRVMASSPLLTMTLETARAAPLWMRP